MVWLVRLCFLWHVASALPHVSHFALTPGAELVSTSGIEEDEPSLPKLLRGARRNKRKRQNAEFFSTDVNASNETMIAASYGQKLEVILQCSFSIIKRDFNM